MHRASDLILDHFLFFNKHDRSLMQHYICQLLKRVTLACNPEVEITVGSICEGERYVKELVIDLKKPINY